MKLSVNQKKLVWYIVSLVLLFAVQPRSLGFFVSVGNAFLLFFAVIIIVSAREESI